MDLKNKKIEKLDEQIGEVTRMIEEHHRMRDMMVRHRGEATVEQRLMLLEEQMHGVQLYVLHDTRNNLMASKAAALNEEIELRHIEFMQILPRVIGKKPGEA